MDERRTAGPAVAGEPMGLRDRAIGYGEAWIRHDAVRSFMVMMEAGPERGKVRRMRQASPQRVALEELEE